jgi:hypothetical protein
MFSPEHAYSKRCHVIRSESFDRSEEMHGVGPLRVRLRQMHAIQLRNDAPALVLDQKDDFGED